jgi:hypothetical protein
LEWLAVHGVLHPNETEFTAAVNNAVGGSSSAAAAPLRHTKPHIHELDLHHDSARRLVPEFNALFGRFAAETADLPRALEQYLPNLALAGGTASTTVKLQYNDGGGGCFPLHYDNPGRPNNRLVTCLVYLNPKWQQGDGGEIQLVPFCGPCVTIPPIHDRLVVFRSDRILHRVLPSRVPRYCFTIWLDGTTANGDDDVYLKTKHLAGGTEKTLERLRDSGLQRLVARSVYSEAYEQSLLDCQGESASCMVDSHQAQVAATHQTPAIAEVVDSLRARNMLHATHQPLIANSL